MGLPGALRILEDQVIDGGDLIGAEMQSLRQGA
jgi:hypothetical protein